MRKIVYRTCMGCNEKKEKNELIRIVANKQDEVLIDLTGKLEGRGAYICKRKECLDRIIKSKKLERALKIKIDEKIYSNLRGVIIGEEEQNEKC